MANFNLGQHLDHPDPDPASVVVVVEEDEDDEAGTKERRQSLRKKRHYKKDSRFLQDLYTLTFDENETVDQIATNKAHIFDVEEDSFVSL
jgi:hypothetical protein